MRALNLLGVLWVSVNAVACCREEPLRAPCDAGTVTLNGLPAVAVAETSVRSSDMALPLSAAERQLLIAYLRAGGNNDVLNEDLVIPDADQHYAGLLDLLANPENLDVDDLGSASYRAWFSPKAVTQVIDAREARPAELASARAVTDGRFWWVFRRIGSGRFDRLVVFKALGDNK